MYKLDRQDYPRVRPVFQGPNPTLIVDSIIGGHTPAWVYVDDVQSPRMAWMWDLQGEMFVGGEAQHMPANRALGHLIAQQVVPHARARGIPGLALFYDTPAWEAQITTILSGFKVEQVARRRYGFSQPALDWRVALPDKYALYRLDKSWLSRRDQVFHMDQLIGWINSFWHSHQDFLDHSFGFFVLCKESVTSWCLGVFASGSEVELGVATIPQYRGQNLATAAAARCVAFCTEHGLTPHWHCWEHNRPSWHVAEKIGFVDPTTYSVYHMDIGT